MSAKLPFGAFLVYNDFGATPKRKNCLDLAHTYRTFDRTQCPHCGGVLEVTTVDGRLKETCLNPKHAEGRIE